MKNKDMIVVKKILQYCSQIEEAMKMFSSDYKIFRTNSIFQNACCMCILQIGELAKVLSDECKHKYNDVPWREWCGIRDIFAHQYYNIDNASTWATLTKDVPALKERCKEILEVISKEEEL
jgi:uncharacterized protein with HEPN domain